MPDRRCSGRYGVFNDNAQPGYRVLDGGAVECGFCALETAKQLGEFLGLLVIASQRSPTMTNVVRHELRKARQSHTCMTLSDLASALEFGQILPYYQPKACFRQRHGWPIYEVEALPAWRISEANWMPGGSRHV